MKNKNLQKAIECLRISDVYVRNLDSKCNENFDPKYSDMDQLAIQTKHLVSKSEVVQGDDEKKIFRVFVEVGVKWLAEEASSKEDVNPTALIEAEFVAEYNITNDLEDECLDEFALKNVSYHVWPYWRELLTSQCERMRLPRLFLPMTQIAQNQGATKSNQ
jgi:hypothetical protein